MTKIIDITPDEEKTLFTPEDLEFLRRSWSNYQYHITEEHQIFLHMITADISEEMCELLVEAIEHSHPSATTLWIYREVI